MSIPGRRLDARAIAAAVRQPRCRPWHPGRLDFHAFEPAQQRVVSLAWRQRIQRWRVPRSAHNRDGRESLGATAPDSLTHVGLPAQLVDGRWRKRVAHTTHRLCYRTEYVGIVGALLYQALPPALRVGFAGGLGQKPNRVAWLLIGCQLTLSLRQTDRLRQITKAHGNLATESVVNRVPLGRKRGERVEDAGTRSFGGVHRQRHRRPHAGCSNQGYERLGIRWAFDQQHVRSQPLQCVYHRPGRSGPVMANPQNGNSFGHNSSRVARYRSRQPSRSRTTVSRYSLKAIVSRTGSWTTAPTRPAATSAARRRPSPKCAASVSPLVTTEMASAGERVLLGTFSLTF